MSEKEPKVIKTVNQKFAETNEEFIEACKRVGVPPTARQASKFRNGKGVAYLKGRNVVHARSKLPRPVRKINATPKIRR